MNKIIITAAVTGAVHTPTMSEFLPITPDDIVADALKAYRAGAAVAHIHVRDPENGRPSASPELFRKVHASIKEQCDLIILPTTGGGPGMTAQEKLKVIHELRPEMCSFDPAPFNLGLFQLVKRFQGSFKYQWETDFLMYLKDNIGMQMTFQDDLTYAKTFLDLNVKPEFELYEPGHLGYVTWLMEEGLVKTPPHLQFVFGPVVGWMEPSVKHLVMMYEEAVDKLGRGHFTWSVAAGGKWQMPLAATAMAMGAPNVRVGLEDSLWAGRGRLAKSSADQVEMVVRIGEQLGLDPATPSEARQLFGLNA